MLTLIWTLAALAVSLGALIFVRAHDPKRRRVLGLAAGTAPSYSGLGWAVAFFPGVALLAIGNPAAFILWIAALTVLGWLMARHTVKRS